MPRHFRARKSREVRAFLESRGFRLLITHGDDDVYEKSGCKFTVKIPNRDNEEIPIGTMQYIKKMIRNCGINPKEILKWWRDNGFGE